MTFYRESRESHPARFFGGLLVCLMGLVPMILIGLAFEPAHLRDPAFYLFTACSLFLALAGFYGILTAHRPRSPEFIQWDDERVTWGRKNGKTTAVPLGEIRALNWCEDIDDNLSLTIETTNDRNIRVSASLDRIVRGRPERKALHDYLRARHPTIPLRLSGTFDRYGTEDA